MLNVGHDLQSSFWEAHMSYLLFCWGKEQRNNSHLMGWRQLSSLLAKGTLLLHCLSFFPIDVKVVLLVGHRLEWAVLVIVFPEVSCIHSHAGFPTRVGEHWGEKALNWGCSSQAGSVPKAPAFRKQIQIQILNIHKNQNGGTFDLLPARLTFFLFSFPFCL
jgi:hypothetical protein